MLLEEGTSALHAVSERSVQEALDQACSDRTSIVVVHRRHGLALELMNMMLSTCYIGQTSNTRTCSFFTYFVTTFQI